MASSDTMHVKKDYSKPQIRVIELYADEVLATGCKNDFGSAPLAAPCIAGACAGEGS